MSYVDEVLEVVKKKKKKEKNSIENIIFRKHL